METVLHKFFLPKGDDLRVKLPQELAGRRVEVTVRLAEETGSTFQAASEHLLEKEWLNTDEDQAWEKL
jgi:hypothetical protein